MSMVPQNLRYTPRALAGDYVRAGIGVALTGGPLVVVPTDSAATWVLGLVVVWVMPWLVTDRDPPNRKLARVAPDRPGAVGRTQARHDLDAAQPLGLRLPDRRPDPVRRRGHIHVRDAERGERVHDRVHHHGERGRDAGFAAALDAQRIALGRVFRKRDVERRHVLLLAEMTDVIERLERLVGDAAERGRLSAAGVARAGGFTWARAARLHAEVLARSGYPAG